jgi:hypothetical protein
LSPVYEDSLRIHAMKTRLALLVLLMSPLSWRLLS